MQKEKWWEEIWADWSAKPWLYILVACMGAVFWLLALCLYQLYQLYPIEKGGDLAAWVQAIGSIGAILAAIGIGNRQNKTSMRLFESSEKKKRLNQIARFNDDLNMVLQMVWRMHTTIYASVSVPKNIFKYLDFEENVTRACTGVEFFNIKIRITDDKLKVLICKLIAKTFCSFLDDSMEVYYTNKKIIRSMNEINFLSVPFSNIAEVILVYTGKFEALTEKISRYSMVMNLQGEDSDDAEALAEEIYEFSLGILEDANEVIRAIEHVKFHLSDE